MGMMNPLYDGVRLDLVVLELLAVGILFLRLPLGFWNIWEFIGRRGDAGNPHGPNNHQGASGPPGAPWCLVVPTGLLPGAFLAPKVSSGPKKPSKSFVAFGLRLVLIFCEVKNKQK